jgi:2-hydroxy fatty acid dioxygenase
LIPLLSKLNLQSLNLGTLTAAVYSTLYLYLSPNLPGLTLAPIVLSFASLSNILHSRYSSTKVNSIAAAIHIVSWIAQFIGHGKFEGRKPALMDNITQSLFLAPLFVWYEVILKLGFFKNFHKEVNARIDEEVRKLNAEKKE